MTDRKINALPGSDDVLRTVLPNGITVLVRENFSNQSVVMTGYLAVGSLQEPDDKEGLADFAAAALMRGTLNRPFDALHGELEGIGASLGVSGGGYSTGFSGKALAEDLPTILALLSDVLRNPAYPTDQTERLRGEILTGLKIRLQDTRAVAYDALSSLMYPPDHPYGKGSLQSEVESMNRLTLDELRAFHHKHYGPRGMVITIVGAVRPEDVVKMVAETFGEWSNPEQPSVPSVPSAPSIPEPRRSAKVVAGKTQSDIILGWPGPARKAPDFQAAMLANNILGVFGMMGRIGHSVREEQGLAYYAYSSLSGGHGPGPWTISAGVNPTNVHRAIESALVEVRRITDQLVTEEELADNKANFTGRLPLTLENNEGVAVSILNMERYNLGLDYLRGYAEMINGITREQILSAAHKYLSPEGYALSVAGPALAESL